MLEGALILVLTVVLVLVVAGGVVAVLALSRRSADEWKGVIKRESEEIADEVKTHHSLPKRASSSPDGPVVPRTASLHSLLQVLSQRAPTLTLAVCRASIASRR